MQRPTSDENLSRRSLLRVVAGGVAATVGVFAAARPAQAATKPKPKPKKKPKPKPKPIAPSVLGTLQIPKIGVSKKIYQGTAKKTLNKGGFCLWNGSAQPGTFGHSAFFAHRTSAGGPMRKGNLLELGDQIIVNDVTYTVTSKEIVTRLQWGTGLTNGGVGGARTLAIVSCSKANGLPTSLKFRLIIRAVA